MVGRRQRWSGQSKGYRFALRIFGPAQLSPHDQATPVTPEQETREVELQGALERVQRPDGSWYVVQRRQATED